MWDRRARVQSVHDGDTIELYLDDGKDHYEIEKCRLFGTFAPELKQPGGVETRDFVNAWVAQRAVGDWPFLRVSMRTKTDSHELETLGRWLGMVYTADMSECLNVAVSAFVVSRGYGGGTGA